MSTNRQQASANTPQHVPRPFFALATARHGDLFKHRIQHTTGRLHLQTNHTPCGLVIGPGDFVAPAPHHLRCQPCERAYMAVHGDEINSYKPEEEDV